MKVLWIITVVCLLLSFVKDRKKTFQALKIAGKRFVKILPAFISMLILVSIVLYLVPDRVIVHYLGGKNKFAGTVIAAIVGSVTFMPGFIAYPLCGILLKKGVPYMVLAAFSTTLMMVGIVTYPIEKAYFGTKVTILRNAISFLIAIVVALAIGVFFGEILG
ncbi:conserved hypothetical protein [Thermosulfidibacter takaii ABI70S6]|uniref:Permease n=1 Tax=Thermosulfidibacter takaii (strain DSM 17441 / JCM 13301 / NBRC 103674 / ABI70S6) TaxID=1298851 RepID=A0A0S3QUC0_THET7|nr:permease [Thermosulfidibacter takaii]BAT71931.1 conserved hypothetical protein [Thermosulfidibacter takaii ABI70S6]